MNSPSVVFITEFNFMCDILHYKICAALAAWCYNPLSHIDVLPSFMSSTNGFERLQVPIGRALMGIDAELSSKVNLLRSLFAPFWRFDVSLLQPISCSFWNFFSFHSL